MVDKYTKDSIYDYQMVSILNNYQNSNLVVKRERDERGPRGDEPSGEPDTLAGKIYSNLLDKKLYKFGDRAIRSRPDDKIKEQKDRELKESKNKNKTGPKRPTKLVSSSNMNVLDLESSEKLTYRPKTKETQNVYEDFLTLIHNYLPDQPSIYLKGALDVILAILKEEDKKDNEKKEEIETLLQGSLSSEEFNKMYQLFKGLVDYGEEIDDAGDEYAGENLIEVPVEFENEDYEEDESQVYETESNNEEDQEEDDENMRQIHRLKGEGYDDIKNIVKENLSGSKSEFSVEEMLINPYFLQNYLREKLKLDDTLLPKVEKEILGILPLPDKRECENKLVLLLKQENFPFIKLLLENRFVIYYLSRLGKSQSEGERNEIVTEMKQSNEGVKVLQQIDKIKQDSQNQNIDIMKDISEKIHLKKNLTEDLNGRMTDKILQGINRNNLDLDNLKFNQGARFMANKKIQLPKGSYRETKKGYDEVFIPPSINPNLSTQKEIPISNLPKWMHPCFMKMDEDGGYSFITDRFNKVQSQVLNTALNTDENMLICAPTSSGKTNIALMAILRIIENYRDAETEIINLKQFKIVYIAPMKALVKETVGNFSKD